MSQADRSRYYQTLKDAGVPLSKQYRDYTTEELKEAYDHLISQIAARAVAATPPAPEAPRSERNPDELPGERLNTQEEDEPIRVDEVGLIWYQEEVRKPSGAKPRGRRVLKYTDPGTVTEQRQSGDFVETFEVAGKQSIASEVKITLPSYQVGIYRDPKIPFKIHVYNGTRGFNLFEVQKFYGGADLVPMEIKRIYVANDLCYDIRTTIRAIENEHRQMQLTGRA